MSLRTAPSAAVPLIAAFYIAVLFAPAHQLTLVAAGTLGIIGCWIGAARLGPDSGTGGEMIPIFLASVLVMGVPVAAQAPISSRTAIAMGLGILAIEATWAAHRFPVFPATEPQSLPARVVNSIVFGLAMALVASIVATASIAIVLLFGGAGSAEIRAVAPWIYGGYFLGGAAAGLLTGLLRPFTRWPLGTMALGVLGGICVYGALAPAVVLTRGEPQSLAEMAVIALICGIVVGPPAALGLRYDDSAGEAFDEQRSRSQ